MPFIPSNLRTLLRPSAGTSSATAPDLQQWLRTCTPAQFRSAVANMDRGELQVLFTRWPAFRSCFEIRKATPLKMSIERLPPIEQSDRTYGLACAATIPATLKHEVERQGRALAQLDGMLAGRFANRRIIDGLPDQSRQARLLDLWKNSASELIDHLDSIAESNLPSALNVLQGFINQDGAEMRTKKSINAALLTPAMLTKLEATIRRKSPDTAGLTQLWTSMASWQRNKSAIEGTAASQARNRFAMQHLSGSPNFQPVVPLQAGRRPAARPTVAPPRVEIDQTSAQPVSPEAAARQLQIAVLKQQIEKLKLEISLIDLDGAARDIQEALAEIESKRSKRGDQ
jgi:hypothetical protein